MGRDKSRWVRPIKRGNPCVFIKHSGKSVFICQKTSQLSDSLIDLTVSLIENYIDNRDVTFVGSKVASTIVEGRLNNEWLFHLRGIDVKAFFFRDATRY